MSISWSLDCILISPAVCDRVDLVCVACGIPSQVDVVFFTVMFCETDLTVIVMASYRNLDSDQDIHNDSKTVQRLETV